MLSWFNNKKKNKLFDADILALEEIHSKIVVLQDKKSEILNAEGLSEDETNQLTGMIDNQIEIVRKDAMIYGATLSHYFEGNEISRIVPKGVDLTAHDFCFIPKVTERMADFQTPFVREGAGVSNTTDRVVDRMIIRDEADKVSDKKLRTISKLPFKGKLKEGLKKRHEDIKQTRKTKLIKYVKGVKPPLPALQREANIISKVVVATIDSRDQHEMVQDLSRTIASVESGLVVNEVYKTFLNMNDILQLSFPIHIDGDLRKQLKEDWLTDLKNTGDFVLVKHDVKFTGKRTGTQSTGPR